MAFVHQRISSRKAVSIGGVVLIHLAIGYAFVNGLALKFIPRDDPPMILLPPIAAPEPPPPMPPEPKPRQQLPDPLPLPDPFPIPRTPGPIFGPDLTKLPKVPDPLPPQPPSPSRPLQVKGDRTVWVTTDDYPVEAIRAGQEGRVGITVRVGANGRVTDCQVTSSSSYDSLDRAACYYYAKRARFLPAQAADGTPVEASRADWVRWQLPE